MCFASWIEQIDEHDQTPSGQTEGSLRAAESYCGQPSSGRGGAGSLQDGHRRWTCFEYLPGNHLPVCGVVMTETMTFSSSNLTLPLPQPQQAVRCFSAHRFAYRVGDISFGVSSAKDLRLALDPEMGVFACNSERCDAEIFTEWAEELRPPSRRPAFESGGLWSAFEEEGGTAFYFHTSYLGEAPYKRAWFNAEYTRGNVQLLKRYFDAEVPVYPLEYPLDELLMIHRLARGEGAEVHACGVITPDGIGRLFVGHSGAGKSTTSRLWMRQPGVTVLSDDRIILRLQDGNPVMYGTPWHGDAGLAEQASAPVHRIFLLVHGEQNEIVTLEPGRAAAELFTRTFVPYHIASGVTHTLQFLERLTAQIPVAVFRFKPDASAIEEIVRAA